MHDALAAKDAPVRLIVPEPAAAVIVPLQPLGEFDTPFGVETTKADGSVSLNVTPVNASDAFGLLTVKVSDVLLFSAMDDWPN